jgi:hypothetical protein
MFIKYIQSGLSKFFNKKWIPLIILLVLAVSIFSYSYSKGSVLDRMSDGSSPPMLNNIPSSTVPSVNEPSSVSAPKNGYSLQPVANPSDLLPKDQNSQWTALNPVGGNSINMPDLLQAGYHVGLDTIGQTLKNANYQLRSDPIIEKRDIGPWMNSTIEPDYGRVPLDVGTQNVSLGNTR